MDDGVEDARWFEQGPARRLHDFLGEEEIFTANGSDPATAPVNPDKTLVGAGRQEATSGEEPEGERGAWREGSAGFFAGAIRIPKGS
jgi:hypothetical protein